MTSVHSGRPNSKSELKYICTDKWSNSVQIHLFLQHYTRQNHLRCVWKLGCCADLTHSYMKQLWRGRPSPTASSWLSDCSKNSLSLSCNVPHFFQIKYTLVWLERTCYVWRSALAGSCPCGHCCCSLSGHPGRLQDFINTLPDPVLTYWCYCYCISTMFCFSRMKT